jgi:hypothetical protein
MAMPSVAASGTPTIVNRPQLNNITLPVSFGPRQNNATSLRPRRRPRRPGPARLDLTPEGVDARRAATTSADQRIRRPISFVV